MGTQSKRPIKRIHPWALSRNDQSSASTHGHSVETTNPACPLCCREVRACKQSLVHQYIVHTAVFWTFEQPFKAVNCCPKHSKPSYLPSCRLLAVVICIVAMGDHEDSPVVLLMTLQCSSVHVLIHAGYPSKTHSFMPAGCRHEHNGDDTFILISSALLLADNSCTTVHSILATRI